MEKMPFQPGMTGTASRLARVAPPSQPARLPGADVATSDWRQALPVLSSSRITLRELRIEDAPTLFAMLSTEEAARFISPPPTTVEGFERFIEWAIAERRNGNYICFAVVPEGMTSAIGLFQMRALDPMFGVAEWGFAIGSEFWGTGAFVDAARMVMASRSRRSACTASRRAHRSPTAAATARCGRLVRFRKACCAAPSSATGSITIR